MEIKKAPRDHRSWEDQIYWTHFQFLHFSQFLRPGFDRHLAIPETFTTNLKTKLPDTVTLKSPSGVEWEVGLTAKGKTLFFDNGWGEFVKDQYLKENDILIFKYNGESRFDVLPFNGYSMCEKMGSYFLRKCSCKGQETPCHLKRSSCGSSAEAVCTSPRRSLRKEPKKKKNVGKRAKRSLQKEPVEENVYKRHYKKSRKADKKVRRAIEFDTPIKKEFSACSDEFETKPDIENEPIIEKEKRKVLQLAQAILSPEGFLIVMKPTHVIKKFALSIPFPWMSKHFSFRKNHYVILRVNEKTWKARLFCIKKPRNRGVLGGGWKNFVLDNNLKEFDVCVFEPRGELDDTMVLDVYIYHVG